MFSFSIPWDRWLVCCFLTLTIICILDIEIDHYILNKSIKSWYRDLNVKKTKQDELQWNISSYFTSLWFLQAFGNFAAILSRQEQVLSAKTGEIWCTVALQWVSKDGLLYFGLHIRTLNLCNGKEKNYSQLYLSIHIFKFQVKRHKVLLYFSVI